MTLAAFVHYPGGYQGERHPGYLFFLPLVFVVRVWAKGGRGDRRGKVVWFRLSCPAHSGHNRKKERRSRQ